MGELEIDERWKHSEKPCKEAWVRWVWKRYPRFRERKGEDRKAEYTAERETDRDLKKSIPQLLADFHMEAESAMKGTSVDTQHLLNANKRMVGMMAQVVISNNRMSWIMIVLTFVIAALTVVLIIKAP